MLIWDKAEGSDRGVDDHTIKFPEVFESSVCAWVSMCRKGETTTDVTEPGDSSSDSEMYDSLRGDVLVYSLKCEPDATCTSTSGMGCTALK